jgi:hypothetical protein
MSFKFHHIPADRLRLFIIEQKELTFCERVHLGECVHCISTMAEAALTSLENSIEAPSFADVSQA